MNTTSIEEIKTYLLQLQKNICRSLSKEEGQDLFYEDVWKRELGQGGGITCVMKEGKIFEKAGVNFSHIWGDTLPPAATLQRPELYGRGFQALGVSVVVHPVNPYLPTVHLNVRFFCATHATAAPVWWFGGGFDLTPYYGFDEDCIHWHRMAYEACAPFGEEVYPQYKKWADDYFFLKHRQEARGIGGIFFDDLNAWGFDTCFAFMKSVGDHFLLAYLPIIARRKEISYGKKERDFQSYRRGRYVEFNLLYDRGTLFGLQSQGRTESILMSLPPLVNFRYDWHPEKGSIEAQLYEKYLVPNDWLGQ